MEASDQPSEKTTTSSFRINADVYRSLQKSAKEKDITLNSLVNHILRTYSDWGMYLSRWRACMWSQRTVKEVIDNIPDEVAGQIGSVAGAEVPKTLISIMFGPLNLENGIKFLKATSAYTSNWRYTETASGGGTTVVLAHDLGRKGSIFYSSYFDSMFRVIGVRPRITQTDESVILRF